MFNWLIDGSFLKDIITWAFSKILGFFTAIGYAFVNLLIFILDGLAQVLPDPTPLLTYIQNLFSLISPYIGYVVDMSFVASPVIIYLIGSVIFRVLARKHTYIIKLVVGWFQKIKP